MCGARKALRGRRQHLLAGLQGQQPLGPGEQQGGGKQDGHACLHGLLI